MAVEGGTSDLGQVVVLLGAAVLAVPIFRRLGLGSVLGYLAAGLVIGPFGFAVFDDPQAILHVAELGVVMLLFMIGLEMRPARLWALRRDIFGLGLAQIALCGGALAMVGYAAGFAPAVAFVAGMGFVLSSTAIVMQLLDERGHVNTPYGQRIVAILLLEDLAIVPLLIAVTLLAPFAVPDSSAPWLDILLAFAAVGALVAAGLWLLNPMFRAIAAAQGREVMTAAALLVVLGAALLMQAVGLSMAMGAFLAGVLLSDSSFRHELEADIEPFRGLLPGLFFLGVGMALDLTVIATEWRLVLAVVAAFILLKAAGIYLVARVFRADHGEAVRRAVLMAQGGEFAFVLYSAAGSVGILAADGVAVLNAAAILSMALTPVGVLALPWLVRPESESRDGVEEADGLSGSALVIGFGRFGQVACQVLLARGADVSIIDNSPDRIREAARFGFKIYYGDGTRLDVLRASGAGTASLIAVCVDRREVANRIVELVRSEFTLASLHVRSFDRRHSLELLDAGVDYELRETLESALVFGGAGLAALGYEHGDPAETVAEVRRRDLERLRLQQVEGVYAGIDAAPGAIPVPEPLTVPRREGRALTDETAELAECRRIQAAAGPLRTAAPGSPTEDGKG